jgi:hypothetical protein
MANAGITEAPIVIIFADEHTESGLGEEGFLLGAEYQGDSPVIKNPNKLKYSNVIYIKDHNIEELQQAHSTGEANFKFQKYRRGGLVKGYAEGGYAEGYYAFTLTESEWEKLIAWFKTEHTPKIKDKEKYLRSLRSGELETMWEAMGFIDRDMPVNIVAIADDGVPIWYNQQLVIREKPKSMKPPDASELFGPTDTSYMSDEDMHKAAVLAEQWKEEWQRMMKATDELHSKKKVARLAAEEMMAEIQAETQTEAKPLKQKDKKVDEKTNSSSGDGRGLKGYSIPKKSDKPGWKLPKDGGNYWSIDTTHDHWQTDKGEKEAIELFKKKPGWVKNKSFHDKYSQKNTYRRGGAVSRNGHGKNMSRLGFSHGGVVGHKHSYSEHISDIEHVNFTKRIDNMISSVENYPDLKDYVKNPLLKSLNSISESLNNRETNLSSEKIQESLEKMAASNKFKWFVPKPLQQDLFTSIGMIYKTVYPNIKAPEFVTTQLPQGELKDSLMATGTPLTMASGALRTTAARLSPFLSILNPGTAHAPDLTAEQRDEFENELAQLTRQDKARLQARWENMPKHVPPVEGPGLLESIKDSITDEEGRIKYRQQYPRSDKYGRGLRSAGGHQAAASSTSDWVAGRAGFFPELVGDTAAFTAGLLGEVKGSMWDWAKNDFKDSNYLDAAWKDVKDNWKGSYGTKFGKSTKDIYADVEGGEQVRRVEAKRKEDEVRRDVRERARQPSILQSSSPTDKGGRGSRGGRSNPAQTTQTEKPVFKSYGPPNQQRF